MIFNYWVSYVITDNGYDNDSAYVTLQSILVTYKKHNPMCEDWRENIATDIVFPLLSRTFISKKITSTSRQIKPELGYVIHFKLCQILSQTNPLP